MNPYLAIYIVAGALCAVGAIFFWKRYRNDQRRAQVNAIRKGLGFGPAVQLARDPNITEEDIRVWATNLKAFLDESPAINERRQALGLSPQGLTTDFVPDEALAQWRAMNTEEGLAAAVEKHKEHERQVEAQKAAFASEKDQLLAAIRAGRVRFVAMVSRQQDLGFATATQTGPVSEKPCDDARDAFYEAVQALEGPGDSPGVGFIILPPAAGEQPATGKKYH